MTTHTSTFKTIIQSIGRIPAQMLAASKRRANMRELDGLSAHLLRDIGYYPEDTGSGLVRPEKRRAQERQARSSKQRSLNVSAQGNVSHAPMKKCGCY